MKKRKQIINISVLILIFLIFLIFLIISLLAIFFTPKLTGNIIKQEKQEVQFYFYDEITNCSLNGYIFADNKPIGKSVNGIFNLSYLNYIENIEKNNIQEISIFNKLGNCFNQNQELFFDKYFLLPEIKKYHFIGESLFKFKTKINSNNPTNKELQGFIQSNKVSSELNFIDLASKNPLNDIPKINNYLNNKIKYIQDWEFNQSTNNWQTPIQTLKIKTGDCEDFSTTLLSLISAYNPTLNCYNIVFTSHITTMCHIEEYYIYYDQKRTELKTKITNNQNPEQIKSKLRNLKSDYFKYCGINNTKNKIHYAFNNQEFIEFNNEKEFIDWQYNLKNIKTPKNIFQEIEIQIIKNTKDLSKIDLEGELKTQTIEFPSKKPFPFFIVLISLISLIIIIIILKKILS